MNKHIKRISIKIYVYICVIGIAVFVALGTILVSYKLSTDQVNKHYGMAATDNAKNFAYYLDGDFIAKIRTIIESEEYQEIRQKAEDEQDESLIEEYLKDQGVWDEYSSIRSELNQYLKNVSSIKYLYIIAHGDIDAEYDMYLMDDYDTKLYNVGLLEKREAEFAGQDLTNLQAPVTTYGEWGWLISDYAPIYDSNGNCVAIVGCDLDISAMMQGRKMVTVIIIAIVSVITSIIIALNLIILNKKVLNPLHQMSNQIKQFNISKDMTEENSNIIDMSFKSQNELSDIYDSIKELQLSTVKFVKSINQKNERIKKLDETSHKDALTRVNNKTAYFEICKELNILLQSKDDFDVAIIMADVNNLKQVNDNFGHNRGDEYLKGCCKVLCDTFKHSSVYRIGGDEFVIIAQNEDFDRRSVLYSNLIESFDKYYLQEYKPLYERYSMSLGYAENTELDTTIEEIFKRADSIMYKNKNKFKQNNSST